MQETLRELRKDNLDELEKREKEETAQQFQVIVSWLKVDESDQLSIFDSISSEAHKYPGTCDWALKQPKIVSWLKRAHETTFLWLQGNPGTGKSVLASQLGSFLESHQGGSLTIRHFSTSVYTSSTQYDQILRSLVLQLVRSHPDLIAHVYSKYIESKKSPTTKELEQLLLATGGFTATSWKTEFVHIIFDGLDECEPEQQGRIMDLLHRLLAVGSPPSTVFKILLSSRRLPFLEKKLRNKTTVSMTAEKKSIETAIKIYVNTRLLALRDRFLVHELTQSEIKDIGATVTKRADGKLPTLPTRFIE